MAAAATASRKAFTHSVAVRSSSDHKVLLFKPLPLNRAPGLNVMRMYFLLWSSIFSLYLQGAPGIVEGEMYEVHTTIRFIFLIQPRSEHTYSKERMNHVVVRMNFRRWEGNSPTSRDKAGDGKQSTSERVTNAKGAEPLRRH